MPQVNVSRRDIRTGAAAVGILGASGAAGLAFGQELKRTPSEILGPFYPVVRSVEQTSDLTAVAGKAGRAAGQVVHLMGRVVNVQGKPVSGARVELWQANTHGRYAHPSDTNSAPLDPNFEGLAVQTTDAEGRFRFKTIKPGPYPAAAGMRAPHLHVDVTGRTNRVITQMYFPGEPLNENDFLLRNIRANKEGLIAKLVPPTADQAPDSMVAVWDVVLDRG